MTAKQYLRLSLLLPIVVPVAIASIQVAFNLATGRDWGDLNAPLPIVYPEIFLIFSPIFGGLQYLVFAVWAWFWFPRQSLGRIIATLALSPLIVLAIHFLAWGTLCIARPHGDTGVFLAELWYAFLLVGYGYVAVVLGIYWALKRRCLLTNHLTTG